LEYPGEMVVWEDGSTFHHLDYGNKKTQVPSLASERWQKAMCLNLSRLIDHIERSDYSGRIIGFTIGFGTQGSWTHFGTTEGYLFDYNPSMGDRFRQWLKRQYQNSTELSKACGRKIDFRDVTQPSPGERALVDPRGFRDPTAQRAVIDFGLFMGDLTAELIEKVAKCVKKACNSRCLVGVAYGNLLGLLPYQNGLQHSGQLGLFHVLKNQGVDFLVTPTIMSESDSRPSICIPASPEASILKHEKALFYNTDDIEDREVKSSDKSPAWMPFSCHGIWCRDSLDDGCSYDGAIKRFKPAVKAAPRPSSEIALVLDDESMLYIQRPKEQLVDLITGQCFELAQTGLAYDIILQRDLCLKKSYRFLIFPNFFFVNQSMCKAMHDLLRLSCATALWLVAPGFVDKEAIFENMERITGIRIRKPPVPHTAVIQVMNNQQQLTYGNPNMTAHMPIIEDNECEILGTYIDSHLPGLGAKEQDNWLSLFSGAPLVCSSLLRRFALEAGVRPLKGGGAP